MKNIKFILFLVVFFCGLVYLSSIYLMNDYPIFKKDCGIVQSKYIDEWTYKGKLHQAYLLNVNFKRNGFLEYNIGEKDYDLYKRGDKVCFVIRDSVSEPNGLLYLMGQGSFFALFTIPIILYYMFKRNE